MTDSPVLINEFSPTLPKRATSSASYGSTISRFALGVTNSTLSPRGGDDTYRQATDKYLIDNGQSNPPFLMSSAGVLTPVQTAGGSSQDPRIVRGFVRRSAPDSGDPISTASLNFMYNPETIIRDYVSYLDQAALDPFNTLYQSGNLVAPPSFVNFSFDLIFDRQIETPDRMSDGVLRDFKYFDMVVRNVPIGAPGQSVPDNGVMMVNPKDITVVFSPQLTVQGRPTNARVAFTKFTHKMVPTRMVVSLTMIITYFGPLREAFGLDTYQDITEYQALIPYSAIYDEEYTQEEIDEAKRIWKEASDARYEESAAAPKDTPYSTEAYSAGVSTALSQGGGVGEIAAGTSGALQLRALAAAQARTNIIPEPYYSQKQGERTGPDSYDCSGLVGASYKDCGANYLLSGNESVITNVDGIVRHQNSTGWTKLVKVVNGGGKAAALQQALRPGDLLIRHNVPNKSNHIAFFESWKDSSKSRAIIRHARGTNHGCGQDERSLDYMTVFNIVARPAASGSLSSGAGFVMQV